MMSEESTNPDLVELTHRIWSGIDRGGLGCRTQPLRPGCGVSQGLIAFEGREALRGVFKDTVRSDEDLTSEVEQIRDLSGAHAARIERTSSRFAEDIG